MNEPNTSWWTLAAVVFSIVFWVAVVVALVQWARS